jgi:biotin transport system ATP-binding protein
MIIEAQNVTFRHPGATKDTLQNLSFSIREGEFLCLLGVNGSGKSTLLAVLAGLFPQAEGSLTVAGNELPREAFKLRGKVALVPQDPDVYILGSLVEEDLYLGLDADDEEGRKRAVGFARLFDLVDQLQQPVHTLSYGQKRKLCLASALASRPRIILLDEPFAGLDHPAAMAMREALSRNKGAKLTQIVVGHDLDIMADIADSFMLLKEGKILARGGTDEVFPPLSENGVRPPCWWFTGGGPAWLNT